MENLVKQYSTLTTGTVTALDTQQNVLIIHNAASLAVTLTMVVPTTPKDGQGFSIVSSLGVTTLTITSAKVVLGIITTIPANGFASWVYDITADKWFRNS